VELTSRPCGKVRCTAEVVDLLIVAAGRGAHRPVVVDPAPATWEDGGRVFLLNHQPGTARHPLAKRLTHAGLAAGLRTLYRPHSETCGGGSGKTTRSREANG
jgi:hypothetical protein